MEGHEPEPFQFVMADFLQGATPDWDTRKKCILGFRGSAKTTAVRWYCEWRYLRVPHTQIIVHSSTDALAGEFTKAVLQVIRDDRLFEHLRPKGQVGTLSFTLGGVRLEKGYSMRCAGINTAVTGQRAHLYVFDDPEPDNQPEAYRNRIVAAFAEAEQVLHPVDFLWPGGHIPTPERTNYIVIGQPHWIGTAYVPDPPDPLTGEERSHPLKDAKFLKIPALRVVDKDTPGSFVSKIQPPPHGKAEMSMMPKRFKTEALCRLRDLKILSPQRWRLTMMIDLTKIEDEGAIIPFSSLEPAHWSPNQLRHRILVIDPADGGACEWGIAAMGLDVTNRIHVLDMFGIRGANMTIELGDKSGQEIWFRIFDYAKEMMIQKIYLEQNLKNARITAQRAMMVWSGHKLSIQEYPAKQNKHQRIVRSWEHPVNSGMMTFEPHVLDDPENARQMMSLSYTHLPEPNDRLDAAADGITVLMDAPGVINPNRVQERRPGIHRPHTFRQVPPRDPFENLRRAR